MAKGIERRVVRVTSPATQAVLVFPPGSGDPRREVGGLTLLERLLRELSELGNVWEILIVAPPGLDLPEASARVKTPVRTVRAARRDAWSMLRAVATRLHERFVLVAGDLLVDPRILAWLATRTSDVLVRRESDSPPETLGSIGRWSLPHSSPAPAPGERVSLSELPTYWEDRRGHVPVHCLRILGERDAEQGWKILLDHVEKRALDLPARYFDPPFEAWLVRRLCPTRVTPNQVTVATGVFGFAVAALFAVGWLRFGALLAIFVEVLDGVDGKLARIKHMTSRAGELEHVLDFFYENSWYVALGFFLSANGAAWAWPAALAMVAFDLVDNLVNMAFSRFRGRSLAEASVFLNRFRLVSGRRNIYAWILLPGFLAGVPGLSFAAASAWAGVTASVHAAAALFESRRLSRGVFEPETARSTRSDPAPITAGRGGTARTARNSRTGPAPA